MRRVAAALLAVPVLTIVYLPVLLRRAVLSRAIVVLGLGGLVILAATILQPRTTTATPSTPIAPVASIKLATSVQTSLGLHQPITLEFSAQMDQGSVADALRVEPSTAVDVQWSANGRTLVVSPGEGWQAGTLYTITVSPGARDTKGGVLTQPVRASFTTRGAAVGQITATDRAGKLAKASTAISLQFSRPVDLASVKAALTINPPVEGTLSVQGRRSSGLVIFTPAESLTAGATYTISMQGTARDAEGAAIAAIAPVKIKIAAAPAVLRFRPVGSATKVDRDQTISVRFTTRMQAAATAKALVVTVDGKPVTGTTKWASGGTVLIMKPSEVFPYGASVKVQVGAGARASDGTPIARTRSVTFSIEKQPPARQAPAVRKSTPAPPAKAKPAAKPRPSPIPKPGSGSGRSSGKGAWQAIELYYLKLLNCTRLGGWVTTSGACSSPGGRNVTPIKYDAGITAKVSRPYAKILATNRGQCDHFYGSTPSQRLRRAGYTSYRWAENIGCPEGEPYAGMIRVQRFFQSEAPYNGGHWRNMMNPIFDRAGVGIWISGPYVRVVIDFYHP